jgi:hypothetical protein
MLPEEYDDGCDSHEPFERAGADGPDDGEPRAKPVHIMVTLLPSEEGEMLRDPNDVLDDIKQMFNMLSKGGESIAYGWDARIVET